MADEALACFSSLLEAVPAWIVDLEGILKTSAERQDEILFANQPPASVQVPCRDTSRSKSSSLASRRSKDTRPKSRAAQHPQIKQLTHSDALRLSQRKRKTASVCSGDNSGPVKYRNRAAAVVYYDGETQKQFEKIVRAVGSSRNSMRKSKMSTKISGLARIRSSNTSGETSSSSSGSSGENGIDANDHSPVSARLDFLSSRRPPILSGVDDTEAFDNVDGCLEKAQSLCERAAHQILRDGDCTPEVTNAKEHFQKALRLAEAEIPVLQRKAERAAEQRRRSEERRRAEVEAEERRKSASQRSEKIINFVTTSFPCEGKLEVDEVEVDDDSDDEAGEFNMAAIRGNFGSFAQMKSSRLTAH